MSKRDYYEVLGVSRSATADEIKSTYRKLARKLHPDVNKAADAAKKFAEVQEAYDVLSDAERRSQYDQFGHAGSAMGGGGAWTGQEPRAQRVDIDMEDLGSMFDAFFGGRGRDPFTEMPRGRARATRAHGRPPLEQEILISFDTMAKGGTETIRVQEGGRSKTIEVTIPRGIPDGARLRVPGGKGHEIILTVRVGEHPLYKRLAPKGLDLAMDLPLTIAEATFGAMATVPTLNGRVEVSVPAGAASGQKLRLRGRGLESATGNRGDLYAVVKIIPPVASTLSEREKDVLREIAAKQTGVRRGEAWDE